ncbi:DUF4157 domain-containing protein [Neoroseomonas rubea]|uniref:eCIS core domain-containing protein n=1 Tax=Neoroseomonas rubea TaxID=2748666 RepID=UPI0018DF5C39|nr:DUF4157 domain-containing protein [Roseomonas rubea]
MAPRNIINPPGDPAHVGQVEDRLFGVDLSAVRAQPGNGAGAANAQMGAQAYAQGSTPLFFGPGGYDQGMTAEMRGLMGHELTHVVQQGGGNR